MTFGLMDLRDMSKENFILKANIQNFIGKVIGLILVTIGQIGLLISQTIGAGKSRIAYRCGIVKVIDGMMITVGKRKNLFVKNLRVISDQLDTLFFFNKNTVYNTTSLRFDKRIRTC